MDDLQRQYFRIATCSRQWLDFNRALAAELAEGLAEDELRKLFARIGERVARSLPVPPCDTVGELEAAFNAHWGALRWGFVNLQEREDGLEITHACNPMDTAFAPSGRAWAPAFLEGVYATWLREQGAPQVLRVSHLNEAAEPPDAVRLLLAQELAP